MYRTYRTTEGTIMAAQIEDADLTVKLLTSLDNKEYVMIKRQEEVTIYNLSLVGRVNEIVDDVSFEEYRDITYARLDQELLEQGIKPRSRSSLTGVHARSSSTSNQVLMEFNGKINK